MEDYEDDFDFDCPKCGHSPIRSRTCNEFDCEDGVIDVSEEDYLLPGSEYAECTTCNGTGIERWCPNCGTDLNFKEDEESDE